MSQARAQSGTQLGPTSVPAVPHDHGDAGCWLLAGSVTVRGVGVNVFVI